MSNVNKLVSVLIPAYNHENYVQETIKSIINQTYQNIELIIIDDGSSDSTWQKIQEMNEECEKRFTRVVFKTKENEGTTHTLNKLLNEARGEYVYIIASDDIAKPAAIEKLTSFLSIHQDYALVVGNNEIIDKESNVAYWNKEKKLVYNKKEAEFETFADFLQKMHNIKFKTNKFGTYETLYISNYIPNGYLIRKSIFDFIGGFNEKAPLEDWYLMLQIAKYAKMKYLDEILFSYRWHNSNTIQNIEKMNNYTYLTKQYEEEILNSIDETKVLPNVIKVKKYINGYVKKYGYCYKKQGIPYVFQLLTSKKNDKKVKVIKLFNIPIFSYEKDS